MTNCNQQWDAHLPCDCVTDDQRKWRNYRLDEDPLGAVRGMINALAITFGVCIVMAVVALIWWVR